MCVRDCQIKHVNTCVSHSLDFDAYSQCTYLRGNKRDDGVNELSDYVDYLCFQGFRIEHFIPGVQRLKVKKNVCVYSTNRTCRYSLFHDANPSGNF